MNKKISLENNAADMNNRNKGTSGQNKRVAKNQGNRGKQLNPNQNNPDQKKPAPHSAP